jgi:hypothetical protein
MRLSSHERSVALQQMVCRVVRSSSTPADALQTWLSKRD